MRNGKKLTWFFFNKKIVKLLLKDAKKKIQYNTKNLASKKQEEFLSIRDI